MAQKEEQQLTELLSLIQIALKNIRLYPSGHNVVQLRAGAAHQFLVKILTKKKILLFGIAKDRITYEGEIIGENIAACSALATILSRHNIASITFSHGISQHSLFSFLKIVGVPPEHKQTAKTVQQELESLKVSHIQIETVDYNYFDRLTEQDTQTEEVGNLTWLAFARKLTSGGLQTSEDAEGSAFGSAASAPEALAAAINAQARQQPGIIQDFSNLLDNMLQTPLDSSSPASFGGKELDTILTSLNPNLREQFLQTTIERCDHNRLQTDPEEIFSNFSDSLVLDMMQQVNKKGLNVSPSLLQLIQKLSKIRFTPDSTHTPPMSGKEIQNTLEPEKYAQYVGKEYQETLEKLSSTDSSTRNAPPEGFSIGLHLATMNDEHLNTQLVRAILIFMEEVEDDEYEQLTNKLMSFTFQLPEEGAFNLLHIIAETLARHADEKKSSESRAVAAEALKELSAADFLDYIYIALKDATAQKKKEATAFLMLLGPDILKKLLKRFSMEKDINEDDPLISIFKAYRIKTLTIIFTIIPKENVTTVLRLLTLVTYLGTDGLARVLHPLLEHHDSEVRNRVMNLLLPLHDETAINRLQSMLQSKEEYVVESAIKLCSLHNAQPFTTELIQLLSPQLIKKSAIERNRKLFIILGRIGSNQALPVLEEIAGAKWPFNQELITNMKQILFYSLKGYRPEDRMKLVKMGLKSQDEKIRQICKTL